MNTHQSRQINDYLREYMNFHGMQNTLECFDAELRTKKSLDKMKPATHKSEPKPQLYKMIKGEAVVSKKDSYLNKDLKELKKKYQMILQAAR